MSKSIIQSIKPQYCELIAVGKKTIEVRKTRPKLDVPFKVYIYCTKNKTPYFLLPTYSKGNLTDSDIWQRGNGKVIGEYMCDEIYQYTTCDFKDGMDIDDETMTRLSCLSKDEISDYEISPGQFGVFGWHISDLKIYDKPKELSEFEIIDKEFLKECPYRIRVYNNPDYTNGVLLKGSYVCNNSFEPDFCRGQCGATKSLTRPPQSWCYVEEV